MKIRFVLLVSLGLAASACVTAERAGQTPAQMRAAALSTLLLETAQSAPERVDAANPEMVALYTALTQSRVLAEELSEAHAPTPASALAPLGPAPDLSGGRSIMSAVHLASYRQAEHAGTGWRELQAQAPALLSGLQARIAPVDLGERGEFLRLKAGPLDSQDAARALCAELEAAGLWCMPSDFNGYSATNEG
jgi:cell division septation protein DedD